MTCGPLRRCHSPQAHRPSRNRPSPLWPASAEHAASSNAPAPITRACRASNVLGHKLCCIHLLASARHVMTIANTAVAELVVWSSHAADNGMGCGTHLPPAVAVDALHVEGQDLLQASCGLSHVILKRCRARGALGWQPALPCLQAGLLLLDLLLLPFLPGCEASLLIVHGCEQLKLAPASWQSPFTTPVKNVLAPGSMPTALVSCSLGWYCSSDVLSPVFGRLGGLGAPSPCQREDIRLFSESCRCSSSGLCKAARVPDAIQAVNEGLLVALVHMLCRSALHDALSSACCSTCGLACLTFRGGTSRRVQRGVGGSGVYRGRCAGRDVVAAARGAARRRSALRSAASGPPASRRDEWLRY